MALTKYSAVLASCALLMACGSKDDESGPATLATSEYGLVSPFDTLRVAFDQAIQNPNSDDVESDSPLKVVGPDGVNLVLAGDSTIAGFAFFKPATEYKVIFSNVKNSDGAEQSEAQTVHFATMPFLDKDYTNCTVVTSSRLLCDYNDYTDSPDLLMNEGGTAFFNDADLSDSVAFAGMLALGEMRDASKYSFKDENDYFLLRLKGGDTLSIKLAGLRANADITLMGPRSSKDSSDFGEMTVSSANAGVVADSIHHIVGIEHTASTSDFSKQADYLIRVHYPEGAVSATATPYTLTVKMLGRKYK